MPSMHAQWAFEGPVPPITQGYGAFGTAAVTSEFFSIAPDSSLECTDTIRGIITYPTGISSKKPVVFRFPGSSNQNLADSTYYKKSQFYREFVASHGYVSVTMQWNSSTSHYGCAYQMVNDIAALHANKIDTSRVGIHGMSQGAAITNWLSLKMYINHNWGANGRFSWPDAGASFIGFTEDWPNDIQTQTDSGLAAMPDDVLYLMTLSDWDNIVDPRTCIDIFNFMGVPDSNKEFMILRGDTINNYIYWATHFTTSTYEEDSSQFVVYISKYDALDYWYGSRLLHSLMEAAWTGDPAARQICMGNGDSTQTTIANGAIRGPIVTDSPWMNMFASWNSNQGYMYSCQVSWNMRQYVTADACFTLSLPESEKTPGLKVFPNPAKVRSSINIESDKGIEHIQVISAAGRTLFESTQGPIEIHQSGVYFLLISLRDGTRQSAKVLITDW